jgi:hypothetical protein
MWTQTSSTDVNFETAVECLPDGAKKPPPRIRRRVVRRGRRLAADPNYPSAAEIQLMTQQIVAAMLRASPDKNLDNQKI